jgi:ORF6N domain
MNNIVSTDLIENRIHIIRGQKVMLDRDLADLYGVETKALVRAMKRNTERFPIDFMFQLNKTELERLRCQFGTLKNFGRGQHAKYLPHAFTQEGVAMLSGILRSPRAVTVNIEIMRAFVRIRNILEFNKELAKAVLDMRSFMLKNSNKVDQEFRRVWNAIEKLSVPPVEERKIGFRVD